MRFTILLGLSAAVSALPLDGSDKSLLSDSTSSGPKLPNYIFSNFKKSVGDTEDIPTGPKLPNYIFSIFKKSVGDTEDIPTGPKLPNYIFSNFKKSVGDTEDIPTGPKLPNYIFSNFKKSVGNTEDVRERSPLPEAEKVVVKTQCRQLNRPPSATTLPPPAGCVLSWVQQSAERAMP